MEKFEKLAGLGALGAAGGIAFVWAAFLFFIRPVSSGGMDSIGYLCVAMATVEPFLLLIGVHAWLGRQLQGGRQSITG